MLPPIGEDIAGGLSPRLATDCGDQRTTKAGLIGRDEIGEIMSDGVPVDGDLLLIHTL